MDLVNLKQKVDPERSALIIIDMQKDYCAEGGAFHRMGYDIEPAKALAARLNGFLNQARKVIKNVVARDYHIVIPEDLTEGTNPEAKKWSLNNINSFFGEIVQSEDLLRCWDLRDRC